MRSARHSLPLALIAATAACSETSGPAADGAELSAEPTHLRWAAPTSVGFRGRTATPAGWEARDMTAHPTPLFSLFGNGGTVLNTYDVSFWAVQGETRAVRIDYVDAEHTGTPRPFLTFTVPHDALSARPDGTPFLPGDSVQITVTVNDADLSVHMSPSGLQFDLGNPAILKISYDGAGPDLNTDMLVNGLDTEIETELLGIWTRQSETDPWLFMPAEQEFETKTFTAYIPHFSGYAVSW